MIIHKTIKFIYILFIIFIINKKVNSYYDANEILNKHFNHELYKEEQIEKQITTDKLVLNEPHIYSDRVTTYYTNNKLKALESVSSTDYSSGSAQDYWNGETCEATTFNFTKGLTSCPNDCYQVWGQGTCNETTSQCKCNYFYVGDDCSVNYDPDHNWDYMNCNGGRYCPPIYNTPGPRSCICPEGQTGLECSVCTSNPGCQALQKDTTNQFACDTSPYTYYEKSYSCVVTSEQVNGDLNNSTASSAIECNFPNGEYDKQTGVCTMDLYYRIHGSPLYFNCTFYECDRTILPGQNQSISCAHSVCNCTTYCGFFLAGIIGAVQGEAEFLCGTQAHPDTPMECFFSQNEISTLLPTIPLSCVTGECINLSLPPPPPIWPVPIAKMNFLYFYISSGIGFVIFTLIVGAIFLIFSLQEDRKKFIEDTHLIVELSFKNISCYVKERNGWFFGYGGKETTKTILDNINGVCPPGQLTALMGLSGSGKTSLLDILSGRKNVGMIEGSVLINGAPVGKNFKRISGYVTQDDIMIGTLTCREHLMYAALLKLPEHMSLEYKKQRVTSVLDELGLTKVADNSIGTPEKRGISGGERRRLSIATELIVNPSILFLDEPTSGLDSHSAAELISKLKQLANNTVTGQRTIIFSIHQPSAEIFEQFDNLILLHQGNPYFSGKAEDSVNYFVQKKIASMNEPEQQSYKMHLKNPADFIISMVTDKNCQRVYSTYSSSSKVSSPQIRRQPGLPSPAASSSNNRNNNNRNINLNPDDNDNNPSSAEIGDDQPLILSGDIEDNLGNNGNIGDQPLASHVKIGNVEEYATSFWTQFFVVCRRSLLNYMRNPFLLRTTYFVHVFVGLTLGYLFWKLPNNLEPGCQNRFGAMFFMTALLSFGSITSLDLFYNDRIIFIRERANGFYRTSAYFLAKVVTDIIPMRVLPPILLGSICYYMIGLRPGMLHFVYFIISLVLTSTVASSMCMAISTISPSFGTANMVSILLLFVFLLFDGFLLARSSIPKYLIGLVWISFMSYGLEIPVVNEFDGLWIEYNPPNTSPTYADGLEFLSTIGADPNRLFTDMYVLVGMITGYLLLAYVFLRFLVREYR